MVGNTFVISIVFPYRSDGGERDRILTWVEARYRHQLPDAEIVYGCDHGDPQFNRGQAINDGVEQSTGDILVISDIDVFVRTVNMRGAIQVAARDIDNAWVIPWSTFYVLTKPASEHVRYANPVDDILVENLDWEDRLPPVPQGMFVVGRSAFERTGGMDEGFIGWGFEDNAFAHAARNTAKLRLSTLPGGCGHIWHPRTVNDGFSQPNIDHNRQRWETLRCGS